MEIELHPAVSLLPETYNVLVAPVEMPAVALNTRLDREEIQDSLHLWQLFPHPQLAGSPVFPGGAAGLHSLPAHDLSRRRTITPSSSWSRTRFSTKIAAEMVEYVAQALKQTSREATIMFYSPALDPHHQKMTELADRMFCFYEITKAPSTDWAESETKTSGDQATLEAYS